MLDIGDGGNRYCQGAVVLWPPVDAFPRKYKKYVQEGVRFMEERGIKPFHKFRSSYGAREMERMIIDTGVMKKKPKTLPKKLKTLPKKFRTLLKKTKPLPKKS